MKTIKAIIGLGNPGPRFFKTRHNIGFRVLDALADHFQLSFQVQGNMEIATISSFDHPIFLIKPQTFMNDSGKIASFLQKKNIKQENMLVIHDELELPFGTVKCKLGGSAKGHNGLRSLIASMGPNFHKIRCGIGRPAHQSEVPNFVLEPFSQSEQEVNHLIRTAVHQTLNLLNEPSTID